MCARSTQHEKLQSATQQQSMYWLNLTVGFRAQETAEGPTNIDLMLLDHGATGEAA